MVQQIEIENIEEMRLREGIDDVELRNEIMALAPGSLVNLTFVSGTGSSETLRVHITKINGVRFLGNLAEKPKTSGLAKMSADTIIAFTSEQIHSIASSRVMDTSRKPSVGNSLSGRSE